MAQFAAKSYTVSATPNEPLMGSAYGSGSYRYGSTATLSATASEGYHFVQWSDGSTDNPRLATVHADVQYTAQFAINTYTIILVSAKTMTYL